MNRLPEKRTGHRAFTLIEVIAVLLVLGILAAAAVGRVLSTQHDLVAQTDIVKSHLRFAQMKALNDDTATWGIAFAGNSYTLYYEGAPSAVGFPGESSSTRSLPSGITITNPVTVHFDLWGSPGVSDVSLILSDGGATASITIAGSTGFIS